MAAFLLRLLTLLAAIIGAALKAAGVMPAAACWWLLFACVGALALAGLLDHPRP